MSAKSLQQLDVENGEYTIEVALEGGSGRAAIESPCELEVTDNTGVATIIWSSPNYDYMIVGDEKFLPVNEDGNSAFEIPVSVYDEPMVVVADTTAMSVPHEIEYSLTFDSNTIRDVNGALVASGRKSANSVYFGIIIAALIIGGIAFAKKKLKNEADKAKNKTDKVEKQ